MTDSNKVDDIVQQEVQRLQSLGIIPGKDPIKEIVQIIQRSVSQLDQVIRRIEEINANSAPPVYHGANYRPEVFGFPIAVTDSAQSATDDETTTRQGPVEISDSSNQVSANLEIARRLMKNFEDFVLDIAERHQLTSPEALEVARQVCGKGYRIIFDAGTAVIAGRRLVAGDISLAWRGTVAVARIIVNVDEIFQSVRQWRSTPSAEILNETIERLQTQRVELLDVNNNIREMIPETP